MPVGSDPEHERFMRAALLQADAAAEHGEVPVGAVVVLEAQILGRGHNRQIMDNDPSAHAEVVALRAAAARCVNYRLTDAVLYSTIEPCTMCIGASVHARIARIVFGATEPRAGASRLLAANAQPGKHYNHVPEVLGGVLADACGERMTRFFRARRSAAAAPTSCRGD